MSAAPAERRGLPGWLRWALKLAIAAAGMAWVASQMYWDDRVVVDQLIRTDSNMGEFLAPGTYSLEVEAGRERLVTPGGGPSAEVVLRSRLATRAPGLRSVLGHANWLLLAAAFLVAGPIYLGQAWRWHRLLALRGFRLPFARTLRLFLAGTFCNYFMLGSTGGDLVRAVMAARLATAPAGPGVTAAVLTVVVDRGLGLVALTILCALSLPRFSELPAAAALWTLLLAGLAAGALLLVAASTTAVVRRLGEGLRDRLAARAPRLRPAADEALAYLAARGQLLALLPVSLGCLLACCSCYLLCAAALGAGSPGLWALALPTVLLAGSLPISYLGFGLMEGTGLMLLSVAGPASANQVAMAMLLGRLLLFLWSIPGAFCIVGATALTLPPEPAPPAAPAAPAATPP